MLCAYWQRELVVSKLNKPSSSLFRVLVFLSTLLLNTVVPEEKTLSKGMCPQVMWEGKVLIYFFRIFVDFCVFFFFSPFNRAQVVEKILVHRPNIKHRELRYYLFFSSDNFSLIAFFLNQGNQTELWHKNKLLK